MNPRNLLIVFATAVLMAWTIQARAQHSGPPGRSPEEECRRTCHINHCDEWVACIGTEDQGRCQLKVTEKELKCVRSCDTPRG